jgi:PAS domain S-box-containing protein
MEEAEVRQERGEHPGEEEGFFVVGLGASAGGIGALKQFFSLMPKDNGMAFVVVLHLSQEHESHLAEILQTTTEMKVLQVSETVKVEPNHVYVIPPAKHLAMIDGEIRLQEPTRIRGKRVPIDLFFRTLGDAYGKNSIAVILSGTGSDGTLGVKRVKENGGIVLAQSTDDAEYNDMPRNAINTNLVDVVLPVAEMPEKIVAIGRVAQRLELPIPSSTSETDEEPLEDQEEKPAETLEAKPETSSDALREVLTLLKVRTGHDFHNYKRPTLLRRIARRLQVHELADISGYLHLLRERSEEIQALLRDLLISVTNFFRDKDAFSALELEVIPRLFTNKTANDTVRVWSCGCATGEEAYSLAMLLSEYASKQPDAPRLQVFATDINDDAIRTAREGRYDETLVADVSPERLARFFFKDGDLYRVKKEIRDLVLFAPHNVLRDPPFSKLDLIACRNLLIYLNRETQEKILELFHFALRPNGFLFLGVSETAENVPKLFSVLDKKQHLYQYRSTPTSYQGLPTPPATGKWEVKHPSVELKTLESSSSFGDLHFRLVERLAPPSILVNESYMVLHVSEHAGRFLQVRGGEASLNLLKMIRPELKLELQSALLEAQHKGVSEARDVHFRDNGNETLLNLTIHFVRASETEQAFYLVIFHESHRAFTPLTNVQDLTSGSQEAMEGVVRHLEEDLSRTRDRLQSTIEQHETSIEELRASNEELQAMNEELHSASEELQTSKEELQSVNEELTTVNHELKDRVDELSRANADLQNLMASTDIGTLFLDRSLHVKRYTAPLRELFNIIPSDIGRPLGHVTHKLTYNRLAEDAALVLETLQTLESEVATVEGNHYLMRLSPYRTLDDRIDGVVVSFVDISERKKNERQLQESEERFRTLGENLPLIVSLAAPDGRIEYINSGWTTFSGRSSDDFIEGDWLDAVHPDDREHMLSDWQNALAAGEPYQYEFRAVSKDSTYRWLFARGVPLRDASGNIKQWINTALDIHERKEAEEALRQSEERKTFLLGLTDALRSLSEPLQVLEEGLKRVGEYLDLDRVVYNEIDPEVTTYTTRVNYLKPGFSSVVGSVSMAPFRETVRDLEKGITYIQPDVERDDKLSEAEKQVCRGIQVEAFVTVPLVKKGQWVCNLVSHSSKPRYWTEHELTIMEESADRLWSAFERAKAEEALRKSEEKYRTLFNSIDEAVAWFEIITDENGNPVDYRLLEVNPAYSNMSGGLIAENSVGKTAKELVPNIEQWWIDTVAKVAFGGESIRIEQHVKDLNSWFQVYVSPVGDKRDGQFVAVYSDITERKRREANLALLAEIAEDFSRLASEDAIMQAIGERLAKHLKLGGISFADVDERRESVTVKYNWNASDVPQIVGTFRFADYMTEEFSATMRAGKTWVVNDTQHDERTDARATAAISVGAIVNVPYFQGGEWQGCFTAMSRSPRDWTDDEITLIQEVTNRLFPRLERARAEERLQRSEAELRLITDNVPSLISYIDKHERYRFVNAGYENWFRAGREAIVGHTLKEILGAAYESVAEKVTQVLAGERVKFEGTLNYPQGPRSVLVQYVPDLNASGEVQGFYALVTDISERVAAEEARRWLAAIVESSQDAILSFDLERKVLSWNPGAEAMFGYTSEEMVGESLARLVEGEREHEQLDILEKLRRGERITQFETVRLRKNGETFDALLTLSPIKNEAGEIVAVSEIIQDITKRKKAEEALRKSEERFRRVVDSRPVGVLFANMEGYITQANSTLLEMLHATPEWIVGKPWTELTPPEYAERDAQASKELVETGSVQPYEKEYFRVDGSRLPILMAATMLQTDNDFEVVGFVLDNSERKRAEEMIRFQASLLGAVDQSVVTTDMTGHITSWNRFAEKLFGYKPEEVIGKLVQDVTPATFVKEQAEDIMQSLLQGGSWTGEFLVQRKDGSVFPAFVTNSPIYDNQGKQIGIVGVSYDLSEQKRAEDALRKSEAQFRELANSMPQIVLQSDGKGKLVFFNERWLSYTGMTREQSLEEGVWLALHPDDVETDRARWQKSVATGERYESEYRLRAADGSYRWHLERAIPMRDDEGKILHWFHAATDIDDFKRTQEALHTSEERQRLLIESAKDFAIFSLDLDRQVTSWNPGAEKIFGYRESEIIGQSGDILFTPEDREKGAPEREVETARTKGRAGNERWHSRKDQTRFYGSGAVTPLLDHEGTLLGFVKIMRDLTEQKQMTEALQASEEALREADKRKDDFLAVLAHELRNPLAPIRTSLEILKRTKNKEVETEARAVIERQTNQMVRLIDDLLDISRITRGKINMQKEKVELSEVVNLAVESSRPLIEEKKQHLTVSLPQEKVVLEGDKMRLAQALLNLLNNAAKYTPSGGDITLEAEREDHHVGIHVKDTGAGIPHEKLDEIFELFTRLERDRGQEGLGIGLNLVKQITELHGGAVEVQSPGLEQGSDFTLHLPTAESDIQEKAKDVEETEGTSSAARRVLVIDDYEPNRKTIARLLRLLGHDVRTAGGGEEGVEGLKTFQADVILLDLNMPGMDGFETARRIREQPALQNVMLVALTGYGQEEDVQRTKEAGFDSHLVKPVDVEKLEKVLETPPA